MPSQKKIAIVDELKGKVTRAKGMVFANYQGLTHRQLEELKKALKTADAELVVTKNTLLKIALEANQESGIRNQEETKKHNSKFIIHDSNFKGPTAAVFSYSDTIAPIKELAKTIKLLKLPTIKFGIIEGKEATADDILRLSTLPTREVLLAQLVGGLSAPIYGLHRALSWNLQKLVLTLNAIQKTKQATSN